MRSLLSAAIIAMTPFAAQAEIRINLRAQVAVQCGVAELSGSGSALTVRTFCNSETFRVMLVAEGQAPVVVSATSPQATVNVASDELLVRLERPGFQQFSVQLAEGIDPETVTATLIAG